MSSFVYMLVLESQATRYDRGVALLSGGRIGAVYDRLAELAGAPGKVVLDVGTGTGEVARRLAARGAEVTAIDRNADMLEVARRKPIDETLGGHVTWLELSAEEIEDRFEEQSLDALTSCLMLSELSPEAQRYVLKTAYGRLKPGGLLAVADEVRPPAGFGRLTYSLKRCALATWTYLRTQTTTRPLDDLAGLVRAAGFEDVEEEPFAGCHVLLITGRRPEETQG